MRRWKRTAVRVYILSAPGVFAGRKQNIRRREGLDVRQAARVGLPDSNMLARLTPDHLYEGELLNGVEQALTIDRAPIAPDTIERLAPSCEFPADIAAESPAIETLEELTKIYHLGCVRPGDQWHNSQSETQQDGQVGPAADACRSHLPLLRHTSSCQERRIRSRA
jgi:hypothetical protein